ncbi:hypothetical protein LB507_004165 [Fusarium sp. FIESC RH6]|nr:hypothetical protein LB507_004165 [Fusarium sp. FIESC RH6]
MDRYQYYPLAHLQFRYLELQPGLPKDPLSGTLLHRILSPENDEIPDFEALSYAWGDQSNPDSICITDESPAVKDQLVESQPTGRIDVGPNLASALRTLRKCNDKRLVWCDSICINQSDVVERSEQVQRMSDIYRYAKRVVVWLGPEAPWTGLVMETVRRIASETISVEMSPATHGLRHKIMYTTTGENLLHSTKYGDPLPLSPCQWLAVEKLLALDWHRRLWTYQEIMFANQETTIIQLGNEEMLWKRFKDAVTVICIFRPPPPTAFLDPINHNINIQAFVQKAIPSEQRYGYHNWLPPLGLTACYLCSDARDKVFSLRNLMVPDVARLVTVDYTKSAKEVFTSFCINHLAYHEEIEFMHFCNSDTNPSWAADPAETELYSINITCHASGQSAASAYLIEPGVLDVAGVTCDEICSKPIDLPPIKVLQSYADYSRDVVSTFQKLAMGNLVHDDECLDQLILMLTYGGVRDYNLEKLQPVDDWSLSTLEEWRERVLQFMDCSLDRDNATREQQVEIPCLRNIIKEIRTETGCSVTRKGSYVRVPPGSRSGDKIAVLLGLSTAIVLRPQAEPGTPFWGMIFKAIRGYGAHSIRKMSSGKKESLNVERIRDWIMYLLKKATLNRTTDLIFLGGIPRLSQGDIYSSVRIRECLRMP